MNPNLQYPNTDIYQSSGFGFPPLKILIEPPQQGPTESSKVVQRQTYPTMGPIRHRAPIAYPNTDIYQSSGFDSKFQREDIDNEQLVESKVDWSRAPAIAAESKEPEFLGGGYTSEQLQMVNDAVEEKRIHDLLRSATGSVEEQKSQVLLFYPRQQFFELFSECI